MGDAELIDEFLGSIFLCRGVGPSRFEDRNQILEDEEVAQFEYRPTACCQEAR